MPVDDDVHPEIRHSLRRSKVRVSIMLALLRSDHAYAADLARFAGVEAKAIRGALYGDRRGYKVRDGLILLSLVRAARSGPRTTYSLTTSGRRIAAKLQRETTWRIFRRPGTRT